MSNTTPRGEPMVISRGFPFPITGMRFRTSERAVLDLSASTVRLRIGSVGAVALLDVECMLDVSTPADPFYHYVLSAVQTTLAPSRAYEYVFYAVGVYPPLLSGPCEVVDHPRPIP